MIPGEQLNATTPEIKWSQRYMNKREEAARKISKKEYLISLFRKIQYDW